MREPEFGKRLSERMWKAEGLFAAAKQSHRPARARYAAGRKCSRSYGYRAVVRGFSPC